MNKFKYARISLSFERTDKQSMKSKKINREKIKIFCIAIWAHDFLISQFNEMKEIMQKNERVKRIEKKKIVKRNGANTQHSTSNNIVQCVFVHIILQFSFTYFIFPSFL